MSQKIACYCGLEEDGHYKIEWWDGSYEYRTQEEVRANPVFVGPRPEGVVHIHEQIADLRKQLDDANGKINALQCAMATASEEEVVQLINKIFNEPAEKSINRVVRMVKRLQFQADNNKGRRIIQEIINIVNQGHTVKFEQDCGGNSVTVYINDRHTHCGMEDDSLDDLIIGMYGLFVYNYGLSLEK